VPFGPNVEPWPQRHERVGVMVGGRVSNVNYTGPTGGLISQGEQCAFAGCIGSGAIPPRREIALLSLLCRYWRETALREDCISG
jgi:hypothetical protein